MDNQQKVVIVTGGAQGIGKGVTRRLLSRGHKVVILDFDSEAGQETVDEYTQFGDILFQRVDVSDERAVRNGVEHAIEIFGRIDGLVNNAGIADPHDVPVESLELEQWNRLLAVNLTGYFLMVKCTVGYLRRTSGSIVNIASTRAFQSEPNTEAYSASKGGIVALTHALAISLGPQVRVNCISPGWIDVSGWKKASDRKLAELREIDHDQHPVGRVGKPEDIASLVEFLLSDESAFITGQNFIVDGGMTRKMIYAE